MIPTPLAACRDDELDRLQADELERRREALERRIQKRRQRAHNSRGSRPASASPRARMDIDEEVGRKLGRQGRGWFQSDVLRESLGSRPASGKQGRGRRGREGEDGADFSVRCSGTARAAGQAQASMNVYTGIGKK